jgi:RNA 2',3'-cyclic 3'-phosphodiesterase
MRLFIAIDLDDVVREAIAAEQKRLTAAIGGRGALRIVRPEQMHLTLVFLGHVDDARVPEIMTAVAEPIGEAPFDLGFAGVGVFPPRGRPNVLWLGVADGAREVSVVQHEMASRVERLGIELEQRPFHPHLTLARWRESRPADRTRVFDAATTRAIARIHVDHVTLYQSRLSPAGSTYSVVARATLSG